MDVDASGSKITRRELVEELRRIATVRGASPVKELIKYVKNRKNLDNLEVHGEKSLKKTISLFYLHYKRKWNESRRTLDRFIKKNENWLKEELVLPEDIRFSSSSIGRPKSDFGESSRRTKLRKTTDLRKKVSTEELTFATTSTLRASGKRTTAKLLEEATSNSPKRASRIWRAYRSSRSPNAKFSADEALSLFVECKFTKQQYVTLRKSLNDKGLKIFPSYGTIQSAKKQCYPDRRFIEVSESGASVQLQALLNHTTERLLQHQSPVLSTLDPEMLKDLTLTSKWGCDGSSGQSMYKQKFTDASMSDSNLFLTSLVPLRLATTNGTIIWQNPRPSSVRFCRPISFYFKKETKEFVKEQVEKIQTEIRDLQPSTAIVDDLHTKVRHSMNFTMIDGKLCNTITSTSSAQKCYVCGASPKQMNDINKVKCKNVNSEALKYGLSPLHSWIRFFECLLHLSYRLEIKKWQIRGDSDKMAVKIRKEKIQNDFREKMGLLVDVPLPGGSGTTNDGNTARRFFADPTLSAEITGIDVQIIQRFSTILIAISSHFDINPEAFDKYAIETARIFVNTYPWFYMPMSVHKILIHGHQIIYTALIAIGQLSESAQESRFKDIKRYREAHTRKFSREASNEDLLHNLLMSSDPLISSLRKLPHKPYLRMNEDVLKLLVSPERPDIDESSDSDDNLSRD